MNIEMVSHLPYLRDQSLISSRNTSTGALLYETFQIFKSMGDVVNPDLIQKAIVVDNQLHKNSYESRRKVWQAIHHRYLTPAPQWVGDGMAKAAQEGKQSPEFVSLAYLYFALRDSLTFLFVTEFLWEQWQAGTPHINQNDALRFIRDLADEYPHVQAWHEATKKKMASRLLSSLRDFGLLKGKQKKSMQRTPVALDTVYHLLCLLWAEGKRGWELVNAPDWRLFLWTEADINQALLTLDQQGRIRFEKSGTTVMLQMKLEVVT